MVGVEAAQVLGQVVAALPGLGHHHHHRVRERPAREHEQLQHRVERRRVRSAGRDHRPHLGELAQHVLTRAHPVDVAAQRVDLAVVGDEAERVRQRPARERVGREARVDDRQRAGEALVAQVGVEARQLGGAQHPLEHHRARREARERDRVAQPALGAAPDAVQAPLERVLVGLGRPDQQLADDRHGRQRARARDARVDRHVAPAEHALAAVGHQPLDHGLGRQPAILLAREHADRDRVAAGLGQRETELRAQERVRDLGQDARAVAGLGVRALGATMLEVVERLDRARDRLVRRAAVEPRQTGDAAPVVLIGRVIEPHGFPEGRDARNALPLPPVQGSWPRL